MRVLPHLRTALGRAVWCALYLAGVHRVWRWLNRRRALIVMYHGVVPDGRGYYNWSQLSESKFRWQLEFLKRHYRVVPLEEIADAVRRGEAPPPYSAAVTFDDGFENNASVAAPHLRALDIPATIFLPTDFVGTSRLLWPDELFVLVMQAAPQTFDLEPMGLGPFRIERGCCRWTRYVDLLERLKRVPAATKDEVLDLLRAKVAGAEESEVSRDLRAMTWGDVLALQQEGVIRFGAHSLTHEILTQLPPDEATHQVVESCRVVHERTGAERVAFAYPNGSRRDFNDFLERVLRVEGASCAVTTIEGLNDPDQSVYALKRIAVGANTSLPRFALKCSGFIAMLQGIADRLRGTRARWKEREAEPSPRTPVATS